MSKKRVCSDCERLRERCRIASLEEDGSYVYVCPECWGCYDYDYFLTRKGDENEVQRLREGGKPYRKS